MSWEDILKLAVVIAIIETAVITYKRLVPEKYSIETYKKFFEMVKGELYEDGEDDEE